MPVRARPLTHRFCGRAFFFEAGGTYHAPFDMNCKNRKEMRTRGTFPGYLISQIHIMVVLGQVKIVFHSRSLGKMPMLKRRAQELSFPEIMLVRVRVITRVTFS